MNSQHNDKFVIQGQTPIGGSIAVVGAKNAAIKALAASLVLDGASEIKNVPNIEDISRLVEIMQDLGVEMQFDGVSTYKIINPQIKKNILDPDLHQKTRSSLLLAGPILLQQGQVTFAYPGGCVIGKRPIDFFLKGFAEFGVEVEEQADGFRLVANDLHAAKIVFTRMSVTGTEAMMTFASRVPGKTTLVNVAMEPEIVALADFLNSCGAKISGAGTPVITIEGVDRLNGGMYHTIPDRIEAGTFAILGAATNAELEVTNIIPEHLSVFWQLLKQAGVNFELGSDSVKILPQTRPLQAIRKDIVTHEYPGFPTDLQAPMTVLMTQAQGTSVVYETIYEGRLFYIDKLNTMGADIMMADPHRVIVNGPTKLQGSKLSSPDIRAGMAMVIAGILAKGQTEIDNIYQIDRGYQDLENRLSQIGAQIKRIKG
ncbi:MAG: UDP-N-acetylglucosamine 1-carboxyvinyltransferase [Candidatus Doudnabacteria bacterium]